jgi:hypothetical protein
VKAARYSVRLDSDAHAERATSALESSWKTALPALRALALESDETGMRLTFEVNMDQAAGETATAKKVLEAVLAVPPAEQASMSVVREATVLG